MLAFGLVRGVCQRSGFVPVDADRLEETGDDVGDGAVVVGWVTGRDESAKCRHEGTGDEVDGHDVVTVGEASGVLACGQVGAEVLLRGVGWGSR